MFQGSRFTRSLRGKPFTFDSSLNQMPSRTMAPVSPQRYQSFMAGRYHRTSAVNLARSFFGEAFHPCRGSQQHLRQHSLPASHLSWPNAASSRPTPMSRRPFAPAWCSFSPGQWRAFLDPLEPSAASNPDLDSFSSSRDSLPALRGSVTLRRWASETSIRSYRSTR